MGNSLYIDSNIYLSFYHFSNEDLQELLKLTHLVKTKEITLYLPIQTKNEFYRNRDNKIADAIKIFKNNKVNTKYPQIVKEYEGEYNQLRSAIKLFEENKQEILRKIEKDILDHSLKADKTINKLFSIATEIEITDELLTKSKQRYDLGNPPGKNNSYGDAINWEAVLSVIGDFESFYFISDDNDYFSAYDKQIFNSFLKKEWKEKMPLTSFKYYRSLSSFFKNEYPDINIATEERKEELISLLANSPNFSETRRTLWELKNYDDFTKKQLNDIVYASISNNQVYWIGEDDDINEILNEIVMEKQFAIDSESLNRFKELFPSNYDNLPF